MIFRLLAVFNPETVQGWFVSGGYFALFGLLFACGLGLPLPEDIPLLLGGYAVAGGIPGLEMNIWLVAVLAWSGIIGGDCVLYWMARRYGMNITRVPIVGTHVTKERILWAQKKFEEYGVWVVAVCRLFAGVRGAMVIAAGVVKFNFLKFVIADGLAALFSGGLFVWLGYMARFWFGSLTEMRSSIKHYEHYVIIGIIVAAALLVLYIWWRRKKHTTLAEVALDKVDHVAEHAREHLHARHEPAAKREPAADRSH